MPISGTEEKDQAGRQWRERDALSNALLAATADLARGQSADTILHRACDALVTASSHIRLAWMYLGDADAEFIRPAYASGPAREFAAQLTLGRAPGELRNPTRRALSTGQPVVASMRDDPTYVLYREAALGLHLESSISLPFGLEGAGVQGVVTVYADREDYFRELGVEPFRAFAHLGQVALEQVALRERLQKIATFDHLTGLLNRGALVEVLEREHARAARSGRGYSLLLFDLDHFKLVNDSYGHGVGDDVLRHVASIAKPALREGDWLGRWGGEEFLALLPEADFREAMAVAERLRGAIAAQPVRTQKWRIDTTVTVGVASNPLHGVVLNELLSRADANLYEAKRAGRNRVYGGSDDGADVLPMAVQLQTALQEGRLRTAYQTVVDLRTGEQVAEGVLARLRHSDGHVVDAETFIDAATQMQLVHRIDFEVISQTVERCVAQTRCGNMFRHFVNVSVDFLRHPELVERLLARVRTQCVALGNRVGTEKPLVIEINERQFLGDTRRALQVLQPLLDFGLQLAISDFGGSYSSYQYLADLPVRYLKLDGHIVGRLASDSRVRAIVSGIQSTAQELDLVTVAPCVEDAATADMLRDMGVDWAQGHTSARRSWWTEKAGRTDPSGSRDQ